MPRVCCTRMYLAPAREDALAAYDRFLGRYQDKYPKACECLRKDRDVMFASYDFPAAHWVHLRTTNPTKAGALTPATLLILRKGRTEAKGHSRRRGSW